MGTLPPSNCVQYLDKAEKLGQFMLLNYSYVCERKVSQCKIVHQSYYCSCDHLIFKNTQGTRQDNKAPTPQAELEGLTSQSSFIYACVSQSFQYLSMYALCTAAHSDVPQKGMKYCHSAPLQLFGSKSQSPPHQ